MIKNCLKCSHRDVLSRHVNTLYKHKMVRFFAKLNKNCQFINKLCRHTALSIIILTAMPAVFAETILVTASNGSIDPKDGACSISEAIINANADDKVHGDCNPGKGPDLIVLPGNVTLDSYVDKTDGLNGTPSITSEVVIEGEGFTLQRNNTACILDANVQDNEFRLLHVYNTGNLFIKNITLKYGCADGIGAGASGGGIYTRGILSILNSTLNDNQAEYRGGGIENTSGATISSIKNSTFIGNSAGFGGGVHSSGLISIAESNSFISNSANYGGALYNQGVIESIKHTRFSENLALDSGGAIINNLGSIATLIDSVFSQNVAYVHGGGVYNYFGRITAIDNSSFIDNSAYRYGGGIYNYGTLETITKCTFSDNTADDYGGGLCNYDGTVSLIENTTFSGNSAEYGGGLYNRDVVSAINNSTFAKNSAMWEGGGIRNYNGTIGILSNTIIASSIGGDCSSNNSNFNVGTSNLADGSCPGDDMGGVTNFDITLADNGCITPGPDGCVKTHALKASSNAIDRATSGTATDQRSFAAKGIRDIGSYEFIAGGCFPYTPNDKMLMICW